MARFSAEEDEGSSSRQRKRLRTVPSSSNSLPQPMTGSAGEDEAVILSGDDDTEPEGYVGDLVEEDEEDDENWEVDDDVLREVEMAQQEEDEEESDDYESEEDDVGGDRVHGEAVGEQLQNSQSSRSGSVSVTLTDPDVLDCAVCFDTLTIPVYQCENGHTACSPCCSKMAYKCPSCCLPIGYNRCRAIEKVLESATTPCPNAANGCKEIITYSKKQAHDKDCIYAPCYCPISACNYSGSAQQLCQHFTANHKNCAVRFRFNATFPALFTSHHKFLILQEENEEALFFLTNGEEAIGNMVYISCMGPSSSYKGKFCYEIKAKNEDRKLTFQGFAENVLRKDNAVPPGGFLLVPSSFFGSFKQVSLDVCIYQVDSYPSGFARPTAA
ncbi:E3 ubiquitin-protein ligase SINA-like 10 [Linum grandiflorum]